MLEVRGLTQRFASSLLFEDVNLKLNRHNRYGLIGANGAGKSTFLKTINRIIAPLVSFRRIKAMHKKRALDFLWKKKFTSKRKS